MTQEELDKDMIESIEMWLHENEPMWVEKELVWLEELRTRLIKEDIPNNLEEPVGDELEAEIQNMLEQYAKFTDGRLVMMKPSGLEKIARYFAQWGAERQKEQDDRLVDIIYQQGIEKGKDEMREQLVSDDLEEAAKAYALDTAEDSEQYSARYLGYKDGAKWQKEQDEKELSEKIASAYQLGLADKEKQMMGAAVEGEVIKTDKHTSVRYKSFYGTDRYFYGIADKQFKPGDKVRIIILKKED